MSRIALKMIVATALIGVATPALSHGDCSMAMVRGKYLNGDYTGECTHDSDWAEGKGKAMGADSFEGTFHSGYPEGKGVYTWEKGGKLEGQFKKGKADGPGVYTSPKNVVYKGQFENGRFKGKIEPSDCPVTPGPLSC